MKEFGKVEAAFWLSPDIQPLSDKAKLLALYLLTTGHGNLIGIYRMPVGYMAADLGWDTATVTRTLHELVTNTFLTTSEHHDYLCINKFMEHNKTENVKQVDARLRLLLHLPHTLPSTLPPMVTVIDRELLKASKYKASKDTKTLVEQVRNQFGKSSEKVRLENKRNREVEKSLKDMGTSSDVPRQKPACHDSAPDPDTDFPDHFEQWWSQYPKREGRKGHKRQSFSRYTTRIRDGVSQESMLANVMSYAGYCDQLGKTGTEYVMQTVTYLNDPDNVKNPWTVNHEKRQGTAGRPSLVDQVAEANRHLYESPAGSPSGASGYHPEADRGSVFDHDGPVRSEVDHSLRTGGSDGAMAGNPEGPAPAAVCYGDQPGTAGG